MENFLKKHKLITGYRQFLHFSQFLRPYWKRQVFAVLLTQVAVGLGLVNPYLSKLVIDDAYQNRDLRLFIILAIIGGGVFLFSSIIRHLATYQQDYISKRVDFDLNKKITSGLYDFNLTFFRNTRQGDHLYKLNYDIRSVNNLLVLSFFQGLKLLPTFLLTFVIVLFLNWQMALMAFFLGFFSYLHAVFFLVKRRKIMLASIEKQQSIFGRLNEILSKMYLIKASGIKHQEQDSFLKQLAQSFALSLKTLRLQIANSFSSDLVNKAIIGIIACFGGYQIIAGQMSLGTLTAIMVYLSRIAGFHLQVSALFQQVGLGLISCQRLEGIMGELAEQKKGVKGGSGFRPSSLGPNILFKNVAFYYYPGQFVLKDFNMQIEPNQAIGLVGNSGCGKSTVLNLLLGLYHPISGQVLIEGTPSKEIDLEFVRQRVGVVLQEPYLWNSSIKDNLLYFNHSANQRDIEQVLKEVRLRQVVKEQPAGLDTNLGDDAGKFSEGQKQRLSLARALLRQPKLLILDEALSFVDNQTAGNILKDIRANYPLMAILIITHNPQLLHYTERIVFMRSELQVIQGTHQQLLTEPEYCKLFTGDGSPRP